MSGILLDTADLPLNYPITTLIIPGIYKNYPNLDENLLGTTTSYATFPHFLHITLIKI